MSGAVSRGNRVTGVLSLLLAGALLSAGVAGCDGERAEGLSRHVEFLWQQHPNPWPPDAARRAAADANSLLAGDDRDVELHFYYQDRLRSFDRDSLLSEYGRRLERNPDDPLAIVLEARAHHSGPYLASVIDRALAAAGDDPAVLSLAVFAKLGGKNKDPQLAAELARKVVELHPTSYLAHEAMARVQIANDRPEQALAEARTAQRINPYSFEAVQLVASALRDLGREQEALAEIESFFSSQPTHPGAFRYLRRHYMDNKQWKELYDIEMIVAPAYPEHGYAFTYAAEAANRLGDYDLIFDAYEKAAETGWYDMDYALSLFDEQERAEFTSHPRFEDLRVMFERNHAAARDTLRTQATDNPINLLVRDFDAVDVSGDSVSLADERGRIVVLDFWAAWQKTCELTVPRLKRLRERYPEVKLISVNILERFREDHLLEKVEEKAAELGIEWDVWVADDELAERMRINSLPTWAVIDAEGVARYRTQGYQAYIDELLGYMIEASREPPEHVANRRN
ncbi:MAG: Thiol-disulfide oxidoreductase ResA [Calditrichaeota bacterium]|nr:Thiol-disulfide oxidoreductase ResA [Calditrichota bacterium]